MNAQMLLTAAAERNYALILAGLIWIAIRLLKSDIIGPVIPSRWRPIAAFAFGALGSVCDMIFGGTPWKVAIVTGVFAAVSAITGDSVVRQSLANGKEVPVPGLMRNTPDKKDNGGSNDGNASPPTQPSGGTGPGGLARFALLAFVFMFFVRIHAAITGQPVDANLPELTACTAQQAKTIEKDLSDVGACVANAVLIDQVEDPLSIAASCGGVLVTKIIDIVSTLVANPPDAGVGAPDGGLVSAHNPEASARLHRVLVRATAIVQASSHR